MGKVHFGGQISIIAKNVAVGSSCQLESSVADTLWSVDSETYASIDEDGLLTIKPGAFGNDVVVTATDSENPANVATKTIKLFYSATSSGQFDEYTTVDQTSNLRNGSWGNPANTVRVGSNTSIGINGYRYCIVKTTRPNTSGYAYYVGVQLGTYAAGTTGSSSLTPQQICELGGITPLTPISTLFPLFEDTTFPQYRANTSSGQTPVSFGLTFDESNNGNYDGDRTLRVSEFSSYTTTLAMFK